MSFMGHILIVDDDKNIRKMVRLTLERAGHDVVAAEDGLTGLTLFDDGKEWDLLLLDQRMPGLAGDEFTREARRRDPAARVMMMTSYASVDLASSVMKAGATDFLRKPFSAETLTAAVGAALGRRRLFNAPPVEQAAQKPTLQPMPEITYYFNGFEYWPMESADETAEQKSLFAIRRNFFVRTPGGTVGKCTVGVTPHVRLQVGNDSKREFEPGDFVWDSVCRTALANYLWDKASMPPTLLPVFELTARQLQDISSLTRPGQ